MANGTGTLTVQTVAVKLTDQGRDRDHNEDCVGIHIPSKVGILRTMGALHLVADGMGGHQAGEVASEEAREVVMREYYQPSSTTGSLSLDEDIAARLKRAVRKANEAVYTMSQSSAQRKGMGTTTVAAVVRAGEVHIANVGDSRAYLFRDGKLRQITRDHSFVQEQIDAGILTPEMARNHPQKNVITRAMGHRPDVEVDTFGMQGKLRPGDKILLCSDGLTGPVRDEQVADILRRYPIDEAARRLVDAANANGG
ncbi:MAG: Stp1/IreP family PP2C-type Ser/Thr phosphatase, partial [Chloroflexi bacterium]|nr:Stp1/IreP family PP2C-type Ser/Thr phosphatase [Chloroflexota bacterium]